MFETLFLTFFGVGANVKIEDVVGLNNTLFGYIDVSDGCSRPNVSVTSL